MVRPPLLEGVVGAVAAGVGAAGVLPSPPATGEVAALGVGALGAGVEAGDWDPPSSRFMTDWPPAGAKRLLGIPA